MITKVSRQHLLRNLTFQATMSSWAKAVQDVCYLFLLCY